MAGNIVDWVGESEDQRAFWQFDFSKVTAAASAIYAYASLVCSSYHHNNVTHQQFPSVFRCRLRCISGSREFIAGCCVSLMVAVQAPGRRRCRAH